MAKTKIAEQAAAIAGQAHHRRLGVVTFSRGWHAPGGGWVAAGKVAGLEVPDRRDERVRGQSAEGEEDRGWYRPVMRGITCAWL